MLRNDPHDLFSIDHKLTQKQIKLDSLSKSLLYEGYIPIYVMEEHELFNFAQRFKKKTSLESIKEVVKFTSNIASKYDVPLSKMCFGGTEKQILDRGTDWCSDLSRLAAVILDCLGLTSRIVFVANPDKAYYGHVLLETYYENEWGLVDPTYGYIFYEDKPISAKEILASNQLQKLDEDYKNMFKQIAIAQYNPNDKDNIYNISKCNEYTYKLNTMKQTGKWLLGEDK